MLDIKWIRENTEKFKNLLIKRNIDSEADIDLLLSIEKEKRSLQSVIQGYKQEKNTESEKIKNLLVSGQKNAPQINVSKKRVKEINETISGLEEGLGRSEKKLKELLDTIPNILSKEVPYGLDEGANKFIRDFKKPQDVRYAIEHFDLGANLGMMDLKKTSTISGSRFVTLTGALAKLSRALASFMIDTHTGRFGFLEISPPVLVRPESMYNVGQLPKFSEDSYSVDGGQYRLIPTSEVFLTNMVADSILQEEELPLRYVAYTECFRSEAGSAGRDTRGMMRNHQFGKVELVSITSEGGSKEEQEYMLNAAEHILKQLDIPYRIMLLCSVDTSFASYKTYDIEAWLSGQKKYREISSISNCTDFQARRMRARYKDASSKEKKLVHTLNGSGLAVGRTLIAVMEQYQNEDGSITVPAVLRPYMGGQEKIQKEI